MRRNRSPFRLFQLDDDGPCARVRDHMHLLAVTFEAVVVPTHAEERTELLDLTGQRRVPVLVDGEILVIGERECIAYLDRVSSPVLQVSR